MIGKLYFNKGFLKKKVLQTRTSFHNPAIYQNCIFFFHFHPQLMRKGSDIERLPTLPPPIKSATTKTEEAGMKVRSGLLNFLHLLSCPVTIIFSYGLMDYSNKIKIFSLYCISKPPSHPQKVCEQKA